MRYTLDTNCWFDLYRRRFPRDTFVTLWGNIEKEIAAGRVITVDAVYLEIVTNDDDLAKWMKAMRAKHPDSFLASDEKVQQVATGLINQHNLKMNADPFLAAAASLHDLTVVTQEGRANYPREKPPKVPNLCEFLGVKWLNLLGFIREERWKF